MAMLQQLKVSKLPQTFGELADHVLTGLVKLANQSEAKQVHFVTDQYPLVSIKNAERERRAGIMGVQTMKIYGRQMKVPRQWKKFLSHGPNKEDLVKCLFNIWSQPSATAIIGEVTVYLAHGDISVTHLLWKVDMYKLSQFQCFTATMRRQIPA